MPACCPVLPLMRRAHNRIALLRDGAGTICPRPMKDMGSARASCTISLHAVLFLLCTGAGSTDEELLAALDRYSDKLSVAETSADEAARRAEVRGRRRACGAGRWREA